MNTKWRITLRSRAEFMEQLQELVRLARENQNSIRVDEVEDFFGTEGLSQEQMTLVFDYLLAQKITVKGYVKLQEEQALELTEEEQAYLQAYEQEIGAIAKEKEGERQDLFAAALRGEEQAKRRLMELYLPEVVAIAREMNHEAVFLGDLIQEGNLGVVIATEMIPDAETGHEFMRSQIRQAMQMLIEEQQDLKQRDKKMVEKVSALDEAITELTEELGRKVSIDELALHMGLTEAEIDDIMKLAGEERETGEEETDSEHHHHHHPGCGCDHHEQEDIER